VTRTSAAEAIAARLEPNTTGSGDPDFLIIDDLNSYDKEHPIDALISGGYADLISNNLGEFEYSYVFSGQLGYLDHAFANANLFDQVTGVTVWHINADEPDLIDYDTSFKQPVQDALYASDAYRSSDHDPVLIGLELNIDSDGDGVSDSMDACSSSDLTPTVVINCDSGVPNQIVVAGCSIMDGINACPTDSQVQLRISPDQ
jgi:predicted extracellular nuclease